MTGDQARVWQERRLLGGDCDAIPGLRSERDVYKMSALGTLGVIVEIGLHDQAEVSDGSDLSLRPNPLSDKHRGSQLWY